MLRRSIKAILFVKIRFSWSAILATTPAQSPSRRVQKKSGLLPSPILGRFSSKLDLTLPPIKGSPIYVGYVEHHTPQKEKLSITRLPVFFPTGYPTTRELSNQTPTNLPPIPPHPTQRFQTNNFYECLATHNSMLEIINAVFMQLPDEESCQPPKIYSQSEF